MAGMSKRHFEALAAIIDNTRQHVEGGYTARGAMLEIAQHVAEVCRNENPQFDRARFMAACGFKEG